VEKLDRVDKLEIIGTVIVLTYRSCEKRGLGI
jgi:hypothetical protein